MQLKRNFVHTVRNGNQLQNSIKTEAKKMDYKVVVKFAIDEWTAKDKKNLKNTSSHHPQKNFFDDISL